MSKILVIPDIHLKPYIFQDADRLMQEYHPDNVLCLMDIPDDFNKTYDLQAYESTYAEAIRFAEKYPDSLWCYGNHDCSYKWNQRETGYSPIAGYMVTSNTHKLQDTLTNLDQMRFVHLINNTIFCHGGVCSYFVQRYLEAIGYCG